MAAFCFHESLPASEVSRPQQKQLLNDSAPFLLYDIKKKLTAGGQTSPTASVSISELRSCQMGQFCTDKRGTTPRLTLTS